MTLVLGLTGGIATGKSTVSRMFLEKNIPLIDTDSISRDLLAKGNDGYAEVVKCFKNDDILLTNMEINRKLLGRIIFSNAQKRQKLNDIIHPKVINIVLSEIDKHKELGTDVVVVDVPLLFESGFDQFTDKVVVVYAPEELQLQRLIDRDNISEEYANMKINAQMTMEDKIEKSDFVIDNSKSILQTKKDFLEVLKKIEVK
jgi:dephospho-CoA kinase